MEYYEHNYEPRKTFNIHSFSLFLFLAQRGILPVGTKQRKEEPSKTVFFYDDTEEVRALAHEYSEKYHEFLRKKEK